MKFWTRHTIIFSKSRDFELVRDNYAHNNTHLSEIQSRHFLDFHGLEAIFQLFVYVISRRILFIRIVFVLRKFPITLVASTFIPNTSIVFLLIDIFIRGDISGFNWLSGSFESSPRFENTN